MFESLFCWSERRDSNPRPSAWKANALSTELLSHLLSNFLSIDLIIISLIKLDVWVVKDSNLRSRKTAELQSAPVGHFGNCPLSFQMLCKGRHFKRNYQIIFAIFMAVIAASTPLFPCIPSARSRACCKVLVVSTPKITGHPSLLVFNVEIPKVTP